MQLNAAQKCVKRVRPPKSRIVIWPLFNMVSRMNHIKFKQAYMHYDDQFKNHRCFILCKGAKFLHVALVEWLAEVAFDDGLVGLFTESGGFVAETEIDVVETVWWPGWKFTALVATLTVDLSWEFVSPKGVGGSSFDGLSRLEPTSVFSDPFSETVLPLTLRLSAESIPFSGACLFLFLFFFFFFFGAVFC